MVKEIFKQLFNESNFKRIVEGFQKMLSNKCKLVELETGLQNCINNWADVNDC